MAYTTHLVNRASLRQQSGNLSSCDGKHRNAADGRIGYGDQEGQQRYQHARSYNE